MTEHTERVAIFPGTFDPITNGHLDVIQRGAKLFDRLIVAVGDNPEKSSLFNAAERVDIIREVIGGTPNVEVQSFRGLTVSFAQKVNASAIIRGIRNSADLQYEYQIALTNRVVAEVETVFVLTSTEHAFTSSSLIKQIAQMGGDVSAMVPAEVLPHLERICQSAPKDDTLRE